MIKAMSSTQHLDCRSLFARSFLRVGVQGGDFRLLGRLGPGYTRLMCVDA
jgi:hypothetical protein